MNRTQLRCLADLRVEEARVLLEAGHYAGACYLLGYAVECALKACIAGQVCADEMPERRITDGFYTHDLKKLRSLAGLDLQFAEAVKVNPQLGSFWAVILNWQVDSRYRIAADEGEVREMLAAVSDSVNGVLRWLRTWW